MTDTINGRANGRANGQYNLSGAGLVDNIEEVISTNRVRHAADAEHDTVGADTLEGQLRLLLDPEHTIFTPLHGPQCGCDGFTATWIENGGQWAAGGINSNESHDGIYNAVITRTGPDPVMWMQRKVTASKVIDAMRFVGAIA